MGPIVTSRADRERHVTQMLTNMRLEGLIPDDDHLRVLQRYIEGTATLSDLLQDARNFALERWLLERLRPTVSRTVKPSFALFTIHISFRGWATTWTKPKIHIEY
jgi:hypothetical protein